MGCLPSKKQRNAQVCLDKLEEITSLLTQMMNKYDLQTKDIDREIHEGIQKKKSKQMLIAKLRRKKIILSAMEKCQKQVDMVTQRRYAVEQLNITSMQIQALKETASVFKSVMSANSVEKIEKLEDTMANFTEDLISMNDALENTTQLIEFDDTELEEELQSLLKPERNIVSTQEVELIPVESGKDKVTKNEDDGWDNEEEEESTRKKELVSW